MRVITLAGSPRFPSRSSALLEYAREKLNALDVEVCHWNLHNFEPEDLLYARFDSPALKTLTEQLKEADGLIVATPIYKASFSGALKTLLDLLPERALDGKVVLPLATGGTVAHLLAVDYALKPVLNALKALGHIDDQFELISKQVLEPVCHLKTTYLDHRNPRLHTDEVLLTLAISALTNPLADLAKRQLPGLRGSEAHFSVIISEEDLKIFKRLGVRVSCEPKYETKKLYHR